MIRLPGSFLYIMDHTDVTWEIINLYLGWYQESFLVWADPCWLLSLSERSTVWCLMGSVRTGLSRGVLLSWCSHMSWFPMMAVALPLCFPSQRSRSGAAVLLARQLGGDPAGSCPLLPCAAAVLFGIYHPSSCCGEGSRQQLPSCPGVERMDVAFGA